MTMVELVDEAIANLGGRTLIEASEVLDVLLDLRLKLTEEAK